MRRLQMERVGQGMLLGLRCLPETQVKMSDNHLDRRVEFEREVWTLSSQGESNQQSGVKRRKK